MSRKKTRRLARADGDYPVVLPGQRRRICVAPGNVDEMTARERFSVAPSWLLEGRSVQTHGETTWTQFAFLRG